MKTVNAFPAGEFVCEECGKNSFFSLMGKDMEPEYLESARQEVAKELGVSNLHGCFVVKPTRVVCGHCQTEFEVQFQ